MIGRRLAAATGLLFFFILFVTSSSTAQTVVESNSPTLAELLRNVYGPHGLTVDSEAVLPDGSTHSGHFNGAFQSEFERFNIALVRQLVALPVPSPASGFTYAFDESTGTFTRSTQSFGPILADRAETIGRGKFAFGYSFQQFSFQRFDGLRLSHIPAVFTHDDAQLGGGRADIITTENALSASVTQSTAVLTFGATDRLDLSLAVPVIRTSLDVVSDATIHRIGTAGNPAIHFFRDPGAPGAYGDQRRFVAHGSAQGIGDVVVRAKTTLVKTPRAAIALIGEGRLPTGQEQNLLGSGSLGLKAVEAFSFSYGRVSPHVNVGYQWNGPTVLAGDIATNQKADLPNELTYILGADVGVDRRLSLVFDVLGRHSSESPRLAASTFTSQDAGATAYPDIAFGLGSLDVVSGSFGMKANVAGTLLVTFNLQFNMNHAGLRTKVTPLVGLECSF
jgi:hypothetical protein